MYNGVGLTTARGSGTNGFVQRNFALVRNHTQKVDYKSPEELEKQEAMLLRRPNQEILAHERKRQVELKCVEMKEIMEEQGYSEEEIGRKVEAFRKMLMSKEGVKDDDEPPTKAQLTETHHLAEAKEKQNAKLRAAFGIGDGYVDGSSFDSERKAREAEARAMQAKKYDILREPSTSPPPTKHKKKRSGRHRSRRAPPPCARRRRRSPTRERETDPVAIQSVSIRSTTAKNPKTAARRRAITTATTATRRQTTAQTAACTRTRTATVPAAPRRGGRASRAPPPARGPGGPRPARLAATRTGAGPGHHRHRRRGPGRRSGPRGNGTRTDRRDGGTRVGRRPGEGALALPACADDREVVAGPGPGRQSPAGGRARQATRAARTHRAAPPRSRPRLRSGRISPRSANDATPPASWIGGESPDLRTGTGTTVVTTTTTTEGETGATVAADPDPEGGIATEDKPLPPKIPPPLRARKLPIPYHRPVATSPSTSESSYFSYDSHSYSRSPSRTPSRSPLGSRSRSRSRSRSASHSRSYYSRSSYER